MIRKFYYIAIVILCSLTASAQIMTPMGYGLPAAPQKIATYNDQLVVAYENLQSEVELQVWNGDFWYAIPQPTLPKLGTNNQGQYKIVDLKAFNNEIYLVTGYSSRTVSSAPNSILKWTGSEWVDLSTPEIKSSTSLERLVVQTDTLICIGKFEQANGQRINVLKLSKGQFIPSGNLITLNNQNDSFNSIVSANGKVYATGRFTHPTNGTNTLVVWEENEWQFAQYPPFLGENITTGIYDGNVVVYGTNTFSSESIKISSGSLWQNMSTGLENFSVNHIESFAELEGNLYAVGNFVETSSNKTVNLLKYDGSLWQKTNLYLSDIQQLHSAGSSVIVSGDFSDNARINFIGQIYDDRAQIALRVYHDKNGNCIKDSDEDWFPNFPVALNDTVDFLTTDRYGQLYLPVNRDIHNLNIASVNHWQPTCPDIQVNVTDYKTYYGSFLGVNQKVGVRDAKIEVSDIQSYSAELNDRKTAMVCFSNLGGQPINDAVLTLEHQEGIDNFTSQRSYNSYQNNKATWIVDMNGNERQCFYISYDITDIDQAKLTTRVSVENGSDANNANNYDALTYEEGSTPVNEKLNGNGDKISSTTSELNYKIGYKNVGSQTALDLTIVDELDTDIVIGKQGVYANTSHNCNALSEYVLMPNGFYKVKLIWTFSDINLPSKEKNDEESEGFLDLKVYLEPGYLEKGDVVCNQAKIYYSYAKGSYQEPLLTQTVCNDVVATGSVSTPPTVLPHGLQIGPNPVSDFVLLNNRSHEKYSVQITNALGQHIADNEVKPFSELKVDVSDYKAGVYFLFANGIFTHKFIVD